ncbi:MAG: hypothetical protein ABI123_00490 [Ginsengibacter sp.]|jgi:hypothetical protein
MKKLILLLTVFTVLLSSCKKEEVTQVNQVDQAFSAVYNIAKGDWTTTDGGKIYTAQINVPELDDIIYQNGAVLVYLSFPGTNYYEAVPQVFSGISYGVIHSNKYVAIDMSALDGGTINPPTGSVMAKIILIDATKLAMNKDVNLKNLGEVQKAFGIK